jgi:molybdenum cofactor cytidylyltransferase
VIGGLILAAGAGTRFGSPKQLADLDGRPLLEHAILAMTASPVGRVVVVLGAGAEDVIATVDLHGAEAVICARWDEGQSASLACGLAELTECEAVVVTLGDQPRLSPEAVRRVIAARGEGAEALRATYDGAPGHPVLLEHHLFERMRDVTGDHGARNLLMSVPTREVPCDDLGGGEDVDTPAQLDALRAGGPFTLIPVNPTR